MDTNEVQKASIGIAHIAIAAGLALCAVLVNYYPQIVLALAVGGAAAWAAWTAAERKREAREAAARAASYANICGPVVVASIRPCETVEELQARALEWREKMRIGGNPYWKDIPVIQYPYEPMLFGVGQLTAAWNIYERLVGERLHQANLEWVDKCPDQLKHLFLSQVMPQPAQNETA